MYYIYDIYVNSENSGNISGNNSSEIGLNNSSNEISNNSDSVNENLSVNNFGVNQIEWENLCKYQLKSGSLSDIPFLAKTATFFNNVMPIVSGQRWSVTNRYSTKVTKSANADNTCRIVSIMGRGTWSFSFEKQDQSPTEI
ncbi:hypothetical protein PIROE2DRAFT_7433 [Piromyces sp. E2]|nr:hypothetical protein PIROE2DRAFT_7433 [Piromyces sp. E2]|eukprot:OUM65506.1 hypothetical protein PIROE2DRAFT_7433 [Piromyces sp. E2]